MNMMPTFSMLEYASSRLASFCAAACTAPHSPVTTPTASRMMPAVWSCPTSVISPATRMMP